MPLQFLQTAEPEQPPQSHRLNPAEHDTGSLDQQFGHVNMLTGLLDILTQGSRQLHVGLLTSAPSI